MTEGTNEEPTNGPSIAAKVVALFRAGKRPVEVAVSLNLSTTRVHQILQGDIARNFKTVGTDGIRLQRYSELELMRQHLYPLMFPNDDDDIQDPAPPDKEVVSAYLRIVKQQESILGMPRSRTFFELPEHVRNQQAMKNLRLMKDETE